MAQSHKGKGKVVAEDNKLKSNTRTKRCRKTLEQQFDGCVVDYSSCEDDEDQAFQYDYEGINVLMVPLSSTDYIFLNMWI